MTAVNVEKMADSIVEPLRKCIRDSDPYVRKTAALAVAKLFWINKEKVEESGFLELLMNMLSDSVAMVVANAVAAITEIREVRSGIRRHTGGGGGELVARLAEDGSDVLTYRTQTVHTLLNALSEAPEWGQAYILEGLNGYVPRTREEADVIAERITPRLQHINAAVVLSTVKLLVSYLESWVRGSDGGSEIEKKVVAKMGPPLISLVSGGTDSEIRYVALRNITLIAQRFPGILTNQAKVFFCKYNDPIFIKLEKLDIMLLLVDASNIEIILSEFKEYASEVDVEFVRKAVRCIGRAAIQVPSAAQRCLDDLLELIETPPRVNYVVQEAIVVIRDIFRRYPNQYESIIGNLCENLDNLDEPDAKASIVWIIGEYANRIENPDELLELFLDTFEDEPLSVQLAVLTAVVKLFLRTSSGGTPQPQAQALLQQVLKLASDSERPDLRDRGFIYWRLLSADAAAANAVVLAEKDCISAASLRIDQNVVQDLLPYVSSLASVYHKPPNQFLSDYNPVAARRNKSGAIVQEGGGGEEAEDDEEEAEEASSPSAAAAGGAAATKPKNTLDDMLDLSNMIYGTGSVKEVELPKSTQKDPLDFLLDGGGSSASPSAAPTSTESPLDFLGGSPSFAPTPQRKVILTEQKGNGIQIASCFTQESGQVFMDMLFTNMGNQPAVGFRIQLNKNIYGLTPAAKLQVPEPLMPTAEAKCKLPVTFSGGLASTPNNVIQIALKTSLAKDASYFADSFPFDLHLKDSPEIGKDQYLGLWKSWPEEDELTETITLSQNFANSTDALESHLKNLNLFKVHQGPKPPNATALYLSAKTKSDVGLLLRLSLEPSSRQASAAVKVENKILRQPFMDWLKEVLA
eukprot:NODE_74_length_2921_cov_27.791435_g58_i0.p1 GENE.NODE_74_length_2921_cov_27.791435_g58_i0~~NODE_74_length_2921_cov_27.791435_g58_i0.p1  ORF type:complete len:862 (-),score=291.24 NODE_74_length_2921_cov_27.791435_g58_i0:69-2654(-)